jgi:hypothetical protein
MIHQQSEPFPMLTTMGNRCPSEISIHFPNKKESVQSGLFFNHTNKCFNNIFQQYFSIIFLVLPPKLESHFFPFRELFPRSPSFLGNMQTLFWIEVLLECLLSARQWGYTRALPLLPGLYLE